MKNASVKLVFVHYTVVTVVTVVIKHNLISKIVSSTVTVLSAFFKLPQDMLIVSLSCLQSKLHVFKKSKREVEALPEVDSFAIIAVLKLYFNFVTQLTSPQNCTRMSYCTYD